MSTITTWSSEMDSESATATLVGPSISGDPPVIVALERRPSLAIDAKWTQSGIAEA